MFALIAGVGLSQMQYTDQNSPRNIFILGFAVYMGLSVPYYFVRPPPSFTSASLKNLAESTISSILISCTFSVNIE